MAARVVLTSVSSASIFHRRRGSGATISWAFLSETALRAATDSPVDSASADKRASPVAFGPAPGTPR